MNEIAGLLRSEAEEDVNPVDVARVQPDRVGSLGSRVTVLQEVVGLLGWTSHFTRSLETENEKIQNETVVLEDESRELETTNHTISIGMSHI